MRQGVKRKRVFRSGVGFSPQRDVVRSARIVHVRTIDGTQIDPPEACVRHDDA